ncbi:hypothetical protein IH781_01545 [Patescibacteria group bacterium]|nr:hypothetical protein [Patescibacteria group bacterium]
MVTAGHEAFAVGGCVRDVLLRREPRDWDVTTNAPQRSQHRKRHRWLNLFISLNN